MLAPILSLAGLSVVAMSTTGCAINSAVDISGTKKTEPQRSVELLGDLEPTDMAIFHEGGRFDKVKVGDSWSSAKQVFPETSKDTYEIRDLPSGFNDKFEAQGWESNRDEGFGVILTENKVVSALYELEHERLDTVKDLIDEQIHRMRPLKYKEIDGGPVSYWFWHQKDQTTMICRLNTKTGTNLTLAMGDDNVLKQLAISEEDAKRQIAELASAAPKS